MNVVGRSLGRLNFKRSDYNDMVCRSIIVLVFRRPLYSVVLK
ncbi:hypothetical protein NEISUBOT_04686 [Neisseria subflava NJ9703]|uniref:Uncharacterized protein n=1 Tax=Neisseria subflava NJ9703 TaxID=546268 RepID=A0A9W5IQY2_NEISU|nr:hypothetical protein NEISUBOT_04686 [Neisseria subflava NJ9703]